MARYQSFVSLEKNRDFFMSPMWAFANTFDDGIANMVARALHRLLKANNQGTVDDEEDKIEVCNSYLPIRINFVLVLHS